MSNRTDMVARLRRELGDTVAPYIWTDTFLHELVIDANDWYSRLFPREVVAYRDVASLQRTFSIEPTWFSIVAVECPPGVTLAKEGQAIIGDPTVYSSQKYRQAWAVFGTTLYLRNPATGNEIGLSKLAMLTQQPWDRPDPAVAWNGPLADEKLLILWAGREAWLWHDGESQRLVRKVAGVSQTTRFAEELERELSARRRRSGSRVLEVG